MLGLSLVENTPKSFKVVLFGDSSQMMMEFSREFLTRKVMSSKPLDGEHQLSGREVLFSIVELIGLDGQDRGTYND